AEIEAAKQHLMFDEHVLVDTRTGALYRGTFVPDEDIARVWGRAARGEVLAGGDRASLRRWITHERIEGAILGASRQTIEGAFLRGELEGMLRTFLQSRGVSQRHIDAMLAEEVRPIQPF